jgi:assimilatory nitrate reductase catalytic subunit
MLVFGSNIVVSAPHAGRIQERLAGLDFLAVCDIVPSETAQLADVVLPVAQWAEEAGTMTNLEGRVLRRRRAIAPPPGVRTDLEILSALAARLGWAEAFPADPRTVFDELRRASAGGPADYSGISYDRVGEEAIYWPSAADATDATDTPSVASAASAGTPSSGTPRLFTDLTDRFPTPDGRARFAAVRHRPVAEEIDAEFPHYLITGRVLAQYQSGAQTRRIRPLSEAAPTAFVELHPLLADRLGFAEGDLVRVVSRRGQVLAPVRLTDAIRLDTVFMPFHWPGEQRANLLTNPALDPISRMPEFKVCAVRLERPKTERETS